MACSLRVPPHERATLRTYLTPDERARAARFIAERARDHFTIARGRLRQILGPLCGCPPAELRFVVAEGGKPRLDDESTRLRFNLAHSNELMLCAITRDREVGIDVEHTRTEFEHEAIARRYFSEHEAQCLAAMPPALARDAFFACWTRKEAVIKATGEGMARPLDSFVVSVDPLHGAMLSADPALGRPDEWSLVPVPLPPGYHGTVAVRATVAMRVWWWPPPWVA